MPSGSVAVEVNVTESPVRGDAGALVHPTAGGRFATVTACETVAGAPLSSVTFSTTVYVPAFANEREAVAPVVSPNTPSLLRSHDCEAIVPSESDDDDVNVIVSPVLGEAGVLAKAATGGRVVTVTTRDAIELAPRLSVAFRRTV